MPSWIWASSRPPDAAGGAAAAAAFGGEAAAAGAGEAGSGETATAVARVRRAERLGKKKWGEGIASMPRGLLGLHTVAVRGMAACVHGKRRE